MLQINNVILPSEIDLVPDFDFRNFLIRIYGILRGMKRHFTATTFIVFQEKVLFHNHKKLGLILPPGGHVHPEELPEEAALREVKEETGLDVLLYLDDPLSVADVHVLARPMHILLIDREEDHQHIDLNYYALAETDLLSPESGETNDLFWATRQEIMELTMPDNVRRMALEALELLGY